MTALPQNLEAEQGLLGAALFDGGVTERVTLRPDHFFDPTHGALWGELCERRRTGRIADVTALKEWADRVLGDIGGSRYLLNLNISGINARFYADGYAELIRTAARKRAVIAAAQAAILSAETTDDDVLAALETRLQEIAVGDNDGDAWGSLAIAAGDAAERAELGETKGIGTGFDDLDAATGGIQPGTLWVVGGATSMGKSIFGAALSRNIATQGYGVGEVHLEMDETQIGLRTATALTFDPNPKASSLNPYYLSALRGDLKPEQWERLREGAKDAARLPIYLDARPGRSVAQIEAAARRLFRKMQREGVTPGALIIDHEGLIAPGQGERFPSMLERAATRGEALLAMGKRLGVGVIALAQMTNDGARANGEDRLPAVTDIKYGGALTQAASVVILLHRKAYFAERKPKHLRSQEDIAAERSRDCMLVIDKSRSGRRSHATVLMDMPTAAVWEKTA